jgi:hypothetical protein
MTVSDDREALLSQGDELWNKLSAALDKSIDAPLGPSTDWTGHDVYAHFARWCAHAAAETQCILAGEPLQPVEGDENEINERWRAEDRALASKAVRARCAAARRHLKTVVMALTPEQWTAFGGDCAQDVTAAHIGPHLEMIGR